MRVLVFHGYLLRGTGSNVYSASLARALVGLGHEVHLLAQDREPESLDFVDAIGDWDGGKLAVRARRAPQRCTAYRPDIGGLLPVYVADRYDGVRALPFAELDDAQLAAYLAANVAAVRDVVARARPEVALANHLVAGPAILARALRGSGVPYAVKVHGSALEYTVRPHRARFEPLAREGLAEARGVLVGSGHVARRLWEIVDEPGLVARTRLGPPGVEIDRFRIRAPADARARLAALGERLQDAGPAGADRHSAFARDTGAAGRALASLAAGARAGDRPVAYVGKLIVAKGVDLLLAAWPLVLAAVPEARLAVVGFGAYRHALERLRAALAAGDLDGARALADVGRELEGGHRAPLGHLVAFLDGLDGRARSDYLAAAARMHERVVLCGRLEHDELADLLPACEAQVVPSTFPEAFGMVAAEAAACGALPISAAHSGLAEVSHALAAAVPGPVRGWLSFPIDDDAVPALARRLVAWLRAPAELRASTRAALAGTVAARWSWEGVARGVIAAAEGRLDDLPAADAA